METQNLIEHVRKQELLITRSTTIVLRASGGVGIRLGREATAAAFAVGFPSLPTAASGLVLLEGTRRYVLLFLHEPSTDLGIEHELGLEFAALRYRAIACGWGRGRHGSGAGEEEGKDNEEEDVFSHGSHLNFFSVQWLSFFHLESERGFPSILSGGF